MERDETPLWARELRAFTEFSLGQLESRLTKTFDARLDGFEERLGGLGARMDGFESRVTRKIDNMDQRIAERFERLERKFQS
jgi:hypothetical protein